MAGFEGCWTSQKFGLAMRGMLGGYFWSGLFARTFEEDLRGLVVSALSVVEYKYIYVISLYEVTSASM